MLRSVGLASALLFVAHTLSAQGTLYVEGSNHQLDGNITVDELSVFNGQLDLNGYTATTKVLGVDSSTVVLGSLGNAGTLIIGPYPYGYYSSGAQITGTGSVVMNGGTVGFLDSSNQLTFTGSYTVNNGATFVLSEGATAPNPDIVINSGGIFQAGTATIGSLAGSGSVQIFTGAVLSIGANNASTTFSGVISGNGGLNKIGTGALTLTGVNTFHGTTTVSSGQLILQNLGTLQNSVVVEAGGTVSYLGSGANELTVSSGYVSVLTTTPTTGVTLILVGGGLQWAGGSTTDVSPRINLGTGGGKLDTQNNNVTLATAIAGDGGLTKEGNGTLTLAAANTYSGGTRVLRGAQGGGTLVLADPLALQNSTLTRNVGDGTISFGSLSHATLGGLAGTASLIIGSTNLTVGNNNESTTYAANLIGTGSLTKVGTGTLTLTATAWQPYTGGTTIAEGTLQLGNGGTTGAIYYNITNNAALVFNRSNEYVYNAIISGTGSVTKLGTGTLILNGANTYSDTTTVSAGTLQLGHSRALQNSTLIAPTTGSLSFGTLTSAILGGLSGSNNLALTNANTAAVALTVGQNNSDTTYSGVLSGAGSLIKTGTGTLTLSGTNTYSGTTLIGAGTLALNGSAANSAFTIGSSGTLTGSGTYASLTIQNGGIYSPGNSPGQSNSAMSTWEGGGSYLWEINNALGTQGVAWDHLAVSGELTITATSGNPFVIDLVSLTLTNESGPAANFNPGQNYTYTIATAASISGFSADAFTLNTSGFTNALNGGVWSIGLSGNNVNLSFTAVPEPSTYAILAGALALVGAILRRRRT